MKNKKEYSVYIHKFPDGKYYIGLTKQKCERRWGLNGNGYKNQPVYEAIKYFGWDNIEHIIIAKHLSCEEAKELEKKLIIQYDSINNGWNISKGGGTGGECCVTIEYNGFLYTSEELAELSNVENLTGHDITTRVNHHGWDIEKALTQGKMQKNILYEYNGQKYTTNELLQFVKDSSITYCALRSRLEKGWSLERALTQKVGVKKQPFGITEKTYEYKGEIYNSYELSQINPELGLTSGDITCRINHHHWDIERAVSQPKKKRDIKFEYDNKTYTSHELAKICIDKNITYHDVTDRARCNWSTWEIVNIPKGITRKQYYKNIK